MTRPSPLRRRLHRDSGPARVFAVMLSSGQPMTMSELRDLVPGVNMSGALTSLERSGRIDVLSDARPFRFRVVSQGAPGVLADVRGVW